MTEESPVEAVFFDATGTLIHVPGGVGVHYARCMARHGLGADPAEVGGAFRAAWHAQEPPPFSGVARADDDQGWWRELFGSVLDRLALPDDGRRDACFAEVYAHFATAAAWETYPETLETLRRVGRRHRMLVVSNFDRRLRSVLGALGLDVHFEHVVLSSECGADKPHPWIFQTACAAAGVDPERVLHVGDDPECDGDGAAAAGIRVELIRRPERDLLSVCARLGC